MSHSRPFLHGLRTQGEARRKTKRGVPLQPFARAPTVQQVLHRLRGGRRRGNLRPPAAERVTLSFFSGQKLFTAR